MKIDSLQLNSSIVENGRAESVRGVNASTSDYTKSAGYVANDTVVISQEARDLENKMSTKEKAFYDKIKENANRDKNNQPAGNLLMMAKRYLDYYLNDSKDLAIKVMDKDTKKVIKEIPLKEEQKLRASIEKMVEEMSDSG
ncbi:MAG: flagellar protein FlaG [Nitrospinae bacterium]|nr:flagellar protein FlaG [Nitrospinota bacterium]